MAAWRRLTRRGWIIGVAVLLLLASGGYFVVWRPLSGAIWGCTLQLSGTEANVSFRGQNATATCDQLSSNPIAMPGGGTGTFYASLPSGNIVCRLQYRGDDATVRDTRDVVGAGLCEDLRADHFPSPPPDTDEPKIPGS